VVAGGENNQITAQRSAILGGNGANDNGITAGIFGTGVGGTLNQYFHVDNLVLDQILDETTVKPLGHFYFMQPGGIGTPRELYIF
jgi:hypothetical protein